MACLQQIIDNDFYERINNAKSCVGLSQEELAEQCQVSRQVIAKWERGDSVPTIDKLIVLAKVFNVIGRTNCF